ncbi:MAG: hypothetical protein HY548_09175 [Elusimicrobia bacterium]|nr:hypothetical protein [Elusimicrobiota bacterium]
MFRDRVVALILLSTVFVSIGCTKKKDRISAPSLILQVSPTATNVVSGNEKTFTARILSPQGLVSDTDPSWTISPATVGTLSPTVGNQVTFTAGAILGSSGTIQVSYQGLTANAQVWVGGNIGDTAKSYGFFSEAATSYMKFDMPNPTDSDGGYLGAFEGGGGSIALASAAGIGEFTEGTKSLKATVSDGGNPPGYWAGLYMKFGYPTTNQTKDFSAYTGGTIKFDFRAPSGKEVYLKVESSAATDPEVALRTQKSVTFDNTFHSVSLPLSDFSGLVLSSFEGVTFSAKSPASGTFSFYIDNLRIEKP